MSTTKKIALITGANKGLGLEISRQLGKLGTTVLVGTRDKKRGLAAVEKLKTEGIDAHSVIIDVTHEPSVVRAVDYISQEYGHLDILVNNAGIMEEKTFLPSTLAHDILRDVFDTNFFGVITVTQAMLPLLLKSEAGRIVNISSALGSLALQADPAGQFGDYKFLGYLKGCAQCRDHSLRP